MIGRLSGILVEKNAPYLLIDVGGIGYELQAPMTTMFQLPPDGQAVVLHTHFSVSESAQQLFGFMDKKDRELFRLLIKVNGVGPKMAVGIMSMNSDDIVRCIMDDNIAALVKVPGVGKKTAERLIIEMRDKLKAWQSAMSGSELAAEAQVSVGGRISTNIGEAESALVALGYKPVEATKAVSRVLTDDNQSSEDIIRLALKSMLPA